MSVYFHANFYLNREYLSGILALLIKRPELSDDQIAHKFGYKAPFTKRYKSWLKKCGILKNSSKTTLTEHGEIIFNNDKSLSKVPTLWFMHNYLVQSEENAEAWNYFFNTFLPKHESFSKDDLSTAISMKLMPHDSNHFGKNAPMIKVITKVLIDSYVSELAFGPLKIVELKNGVYERGKIKALNHWNNFETFSQMY